MSVTKVLSVFACAWAVAHGYPAKQPQVAVGSQSATAQYSSVGVQSTAGSFPFAHASAGNFLAPQFSAFPQQFFVPSALPHSPIPSSAFAPAWAPSTLYGLPEASTSVLVYNDGFVGEGALTPGASGGCAEKENGNEENGYEENDYEENGQEENGYEENGHEENGNGYDNGEEAEELDQEVILLPDPGQQQIPDHGQTQGPVIEYTATEQPQQPGPVEIIPEQPVQPGPVEIFPEQPYQPGPEVVLPEQPVQPGPVEIFPEQPLQPVPEVLPEQPVQPGPVEIFPEQPLQPVPEVLPTEPLQPVPEVLPVDPLHPGPGVLPVDPLPPAPEAPQTGAVTEPPATGSDALLGIPGFEGTVDDFLNMHGFQGMPGFGNVNFDELPPFVRARLLARGFFGPQGL
ncbi:uncharacterized protein LOC143035861 [Oratosquilla oratoria]|uniref:uncharacterized protein LOC143035861 n=1 Tax=Oratosquilla oratoria TaxID=337810 RepID=UPI003F75CD26